MSPAAAGGCGVWLRSRPSPACAGPSAPRRTLAAAPVAAPAGRCRPDLRAGRHGRNFSATCWLGSLSSTSGMCAPRNCASITRGARKSLWLRGRARSGCWMCRIASSSSDGTTGSQHQIEPRRPAGFVAQLFAVVCGDHGEDRRRFDTPLAGGVFHRQRHVQPAHAGHFSSRQQWFERFAALLRHRTGIAARRRRWWVVTRKCHDRACARSNSSEVS